MTVASLFSDPGWQQLAWPFSPTVISVGKNHVNALKECKSGAFQGRVRCFHGILVVASCLMGFYALVWLGGSCLEP